MSIRARVHWLKPEGRIACARKRGRYDSDIDNVDCLACRTVWKDGPPAGWKTDEARAEVWQ